MRTNEQLDTMVELVRGDIPSQAKEAFKFIALVNFYDSYLAGLRQTSPALLGDVELSHLMSMLPKIIVFLEGSIYLAEPEKGRNWDKANRWLGFVQGVLFCKGIFTIDQMREHNRPKEKNNDVE